MDGKKSQKDTTSLHFDAVLDRRLPRAGQSWNHVSLCKRSCDTLLVAGLSLQASEHAQECVSFIMKRFFNQLCNPKGGRITSQQQDGQVFNSTVPMPGCQRASGLPMQGTSPGLAAMVLAQVTELPHHTTASLQITLVCVAFSSRGGGQWGLGWALCP